MESIIAFSVVAFAVLVYYAWKFRLVYNTNDTDVLRQYLRGYPFSRFARRKLYDICDKQINQCVKSDEMKTLACKFNHGCRNEGDLSFIQPRAWARFEELRLIDGRREIAEAKEDEAKLELLLREYYPRFASGHARLYVEVVEALRPFTQKRIHNAQTLEDLIVLYGVNMYLGVVLFNGSNKVDDSLEDIYLAKVKKLVLRDALSACKTGNAKDLCFQCETEDNDVDALVAMKKQLLTMSPQFNSFWSGGSLRKEIDYALKQFLEYS